LYESPHEMVATSYAYGMELKMFIYRMDNMNNIKSDITTYHKQLLTTTQCKSKFYCRI